MSNGTYRLLEPFRTTFAGTVYKHRNSTLGNRIGRALFEDLLALAVSDAYAVHVCEGLGVVNSGGKIHTPRAMRLSWMDGRRVELDYGSALTRIGELYQTRFA